MAPNNIVYIAAKCDYVAVNIFAIRLVALKGLNNYITCLYNVFVHMYVISFWLNQPDLEIIKIFDSLQRYNNSCYNSRTILNHIFFVIEIVTFEADST